MPRKAAVPPPPEIADRIKREVATPGFLSDLIAWADRQCGKLMSIEDRIDPHKALDLVNAAVVDTWDGVRVWHPEARTLRRHLEQTVNSRLWHECERARRRRFVPVTPAAVDDSQDEAGGVEIEMSAQREDPRTRPDALVAQREVRARVFGALRAEAARDRELLALLDAYETGHHVESDAEARVGIAGQAFKNLRAAVQDDPGPPVRRAARRSARGDGAGRRSTRPWHRTRGRADRSRRGQRPLRLGRPAHHLQRQRRRGP
jgi:hypothetical protein